VAIRSRWCGAEGISDEEMQSVAREMNLSDTTFVLPPTRPDCAARVRIFTPGVELPFAGHPTIGTAVVLAREGLLPTGASAIVLEEGVGPVPVRFEGDPASPRFAWMRHGEARSVRLRLCRVRRRAPSDRGTLERADPGSTGLPPSMCLRDRDRRRARPDLRWC
jgi:predicted PhzF superfamily epimerase YddE/YHI9